MKEEILPGSAIPESVVLDAAGNSAWHILLTAQDYAETGGKSFYNDQLLGVRVLGFLLKDLWDHRNASTIASVGYLHLLHEVFACNDTSGSGLAVGSSNELRLISERVCTMGIQARNCLMSACKIFTSCHFAVLTSRKSPLQSKAPGDTLSALTMTLAPLPVFLRRSIAW